MVERWEFSRMLYNAYKNLKLEAKATFWYAICSVLQKCISFLVIPFYVRLLTIEEYGHYTIFLSLKDILLVFATFNLFYGIYTKSIVQYSNDMDRFTSSMQGASTTITTFFSIFFVIYKIIRGGETSYNNTVVVLLLLYYYFIPAYMFWIARKRVEYKLSLIHI